ncbi:MAG: T9SS type B sorting domain-containing protein [Chlorobi bacterium]|nr:T9SS type B sorting domain-containing protein [Chlorobiota bacterium]
MTYKTKITELFNPTHKYRLPEIVLLIVSLLLFPFSLTSQITSPEAIYSEPTNYPSGNTNDPVFFYTDINTATLNISLSGGPYTFTWNRYNPATNAFDIFVSSESGTTSSISGLQETGYRVTADDGAGNTQDYTCWTFQPQISDVEIETVSENCFSLVLNASNTTKPLNYYDPANGTSVSVDYQLTYKWTSAPEGPDENNPASDKSEQQISIDAPVEDSDISVTVSTRLGAEESASLHYIAIAVKAGFRQEPEGRGIANEMDTTKKHSAPLVVRFYSDSTKGHNLVYEWTFGEDGRAFEPNPLHTYQIPGTYLNILHVVNEVSGCEDTSEPQEIVIFESDLQVPNVFTPNGDGINDEFRVAYRSLKKYRIDIYNRWGRRVYSSTQPGLGWDGTIGKGQAAPGVYFYVIEAEGYLENEKYKLNGSITLIRGK